MGWDDLPGQVRAAVESEIGPVGSSRPVPAGAGCDLAAVVETATGRVFVKAVYGDEESRRVRSLRREALNSRLAPGLAPVVLCTVDACGWLAVGFEHAPGRAPVIAPGSADLPLVAATLDRIAALPAPDLIPLAERWAAPGWWPQVAEAVGDGWDVDTARRFAEPAPGLVVGDRLIHKDLHDGQILIDGDRVRVVDWASPAAGPGWVDAALLVIRMTGDGFSAAEAEAWASGLDCWTVSPEALTAFACRVAGLWTFRAVGDAGGGNGWRAALARRYASSRIEALSQKRTGPLSRPG